MKQDELLSELKKHGAVLQGHFALSSGGHSDLYVEKFRALERPDLAVALGEEIAARFKDKNVDVVLSPAVGAIIIGFTTALSLRARFIFTERQDGEMRLRRGFQIEPGERVLVVEDVVTTGGSAAEVTAMTAPGDLVGIAAIVDRSERATGNLPIPLEALLKLDATSWPPDECPLCAKGVPLSTPGSRHLKS